MNHSKETINLGNSLTYLAGRLGNGLRAIPGSPFRLLLAALYWLVATLMIHAAASDNIVARLFQPLFWILAGLLFLTVVTATAIPPGTLRMANACRRIGLVNDCGEAPLLIKRYNKEDKIMIYSLRGFPCLRFRTICRSWRPLPTAALSAWSRGRAGISSA